MDLGLRLISYRVTDELYVPQWFDLDDDDGRKLRMPPHSNDLAGCFIWKWLMQ